MTPAAVGFLVRPIKSLGEKGTSWIVDWGIDQPMGYNRVGATHTDPCNLQVAPCRASAPEPRGGVSVRLPVR